MSVSKKHVSLYLDAEEIKCIPTQLTLGDGREVEVDYATEDQIPQVYKLLEDCRERGDNVAEGEFDDYEEWFSFTATFSWVFSVKSRGETLGYFLLRPSCKSRSVTPINVDLLIYMREGCYKREILIPMVTLAEKITLELGLYSNIVYSVFYNNQELIEALTSLDYTVVAMVTNSGTVKGVKGLAENLVLYKKLAPRLGSPEPAIQEYEDKAEMYGLLEDIDLEEHGLLRKVPGLPDSYISHTGRELRVRNSAPHEQEEFYRLLVAPEEGMGYTLGDFQPFPLFKKLTLAGSFLLAVEFADTRARVAFLSIRTSAHQRGGGDVLSDVMLMVDPEYRGLGLGHDLVDLWLGFSKQLGFKAVCTECLLHARASFAVMRRHHMSWVGTIPEAGYAQAQGWTGSSIAYKDLQTCKTYAELKQENKRKFQPGKQSNL